MRRRSVGAALFIIVTSAFALTSCGSESTPAPADPNQLDLVGQTFLSNDVTVNDQSYPLVKGSQLRLSFEDGAIGASAGCNSLSGDAAWSNGTLVIDGQSLAMTEMACDEPLMRQDTWFADILTSKPTLLQDSTTLTLTSDDTVIIFTDEEVVVPDVSLNGTVWQLDSIVAGDAASSVPEGVESNLSFGDGGELMVSPGCNTGSGSYTATVTTLTIGPIAMTAKACPPPASDVEADVTGLLQGDVSYSIDGDTLVLTAQKVTGSGATTLVYRAS
ncbi:MAG: META domain-containing protein [Actinomycetia bacterium]|nr:META domain-containing protein [Actinomycetes bacterium]